MVSDREGLPRTGYLAVVGLRIAHSASKIPLCLALVGRKEVHVLICSGVAADTLSHLDALGSVVV
jgi:hypothetical protein